MWYFFWFRTCYSCRFLFPPILRTGESDVTRREHDSGGHIRRTETLPGAGILRAVLAIVWHGRLQRRWRKRCTTPHSHQQNNITQTHINLTRNNPVNMNIYFPSQHRDALVCSRKVRESKKTAQPRALTGPFTHASHWRNKTRKCKCDGPSFTLVANVFHSTHTGTPNVVFYASPKHTHTNRVCSVNDCQHLTYTHTHRH